jgi:S-DNA-T family DNA segregation ATPase FtsK/SpoIIIE
MELAFGETMFTRFVYGRTDSARGYEADFADVLEDAVLVMRERQSALRGVTQTHVPTPDEPLIVILIDELAALTGYVNDRDVKRRIANALSLLLSQGRAVGVTVLAAIQDPRKETLPARDLFPVRILLRVTEAEHVHLVFGPGARDKGAKADEIPYSLPGVAFVQVDGVAEPIRVRFAYISKDYIDVYFRLSRPIAPEAPEELAA